MEAGDIGADSNSVSQPLDPCACRQEQGFLSDRLLLFVAILTDHAVSFPFTYTRRRWCATGGSKKASNCNGLAYYDRYVVARCSCPALTTNWLSLLKSKLNLTPSVQKMAKCLPP